MGTHYFTAGSPPHRQSMAPTKVLSRPTGPALSHRETPIRTLHKPEWSERNAPHSAAGIACEPSAPNTGEREHEDFQGKVDLYGSQATIGPDYSDQSFTPRPLVYVGQISIVQGGPPHGTLERHSGTQPVASPLHAPHDKEGSNAHYTKDCRSCLQMGGKPTTLGTSPARPGKNTGLGCHT